VTTTARPQARSYPPSLFEYNGHTHILTHALYTGNSLGKGNTFTLSKFTHTCAHRYLRAYDAHTHTHTHTQDEFDTRKLRDVFRSLLPEITSLDADTCISRIPK